MSLFFGCLPIGPTSQWRYDSPCYWEVYDSTLHLVIQVPVQLTRDNSPSESAIISYLIHTPIVTTLVKYNNVG